MSRKQRVRVCFFVVVAMGSYQSVYSLKIDMYVITNYIVRD